MADSCGAPVDGSDELMMPKKKYDRGKTCVKCKEREGVLVVRHAVYCKECFFPLTAFKFRRSLEPSINLIPDGPRKKALKPSGHLAIGFSGGVSSSVLLDLVDKSYFASQTGEDGDLKGGRDHPRNDPTRVWKKTAVIYVEQAAAYSEIPDQIDEVAKVVAQRPYFDFIPVRLENAFDPSWWNLMSGDTSFSEDIQAVLSDEELPINGSTADSANTPLFRLNKHLSSLPSPTAVHARIEDLTRVLLLYTAYSVQASHLLLGTSLTSLSIALISSISEGGGFNMKEAFQEEWSPASVQPGSSTTMGTLESSNHLTWTGFTRVVRPLRDLSSKELGFYAHALKLPILTRSMSAPMLAHGGSSSTDTRTNMRSSIGTLTHEFITGLERDFPSTVSTIARTCAKLAPRGDEGVQCVLCERPAQADIRAWKARTAMREMGDSPTGPAWVGRVGRTLAQHLCYACHTTLTSKSSRHTPGRTATSSSMEEIPLPVWTAASLSLRSRFPETVDSALEEMTIHAGEEEDVKGTEEVWERRKLGKMEIKNKIAEFLLE